MSQVVERTDATTVVDEYDAIRNTVQMCLDGEATGDVDKLRQAFHPDARMFGSLAGQRYDVPITELFTLAASAPADTGRYRSRILSVQQTGDAAFATVAEEGYGERCHSSTICRSRRSTGDGRSSTSSSSTPKANRPTGLTVRLVKPVR